MVVPIYDKNVEKIGAIMQYAYAGQTNEVSLPIVAKATGNPITAGTVNFYLKNLETGNWFRGSDSSWQASEFLAGTGTHESDGNWTIDLVSAAWVQDDRYRLYAKESGDLHVPVSEEVVCLNPADLTFIKDIMEGDAEIDTTTTPWQMVIKKKSTSTELVRKDLKDVTGVDLTSAGTIVGQQKEP
jgi:hypothetical protein